LSSVSGLFNYLVARGDRDLARNPVPRGMAARRPGDRRRTSVPLVRRPRTLPRVLAPDEVDAFVAALRTDRDRAMVLAMLLGGLRRCEVLGLRLGDVNRGERRLFISEGKGGHQRIVPISPQFLASVAAYLDVERPRTSVTDRMFVVLKGPNKGRPLSAAGLDEIVSAARIRAGLRSVTCHQLRHTCFTRLREAGMALEAIQAQAGHRSIESTRIYLHLTNAWLAQEYLETLAPSTISNPPMSERRRERVPAQRRARRARRCLYPVIGGRRDVLGFPERLGSAQLLRPGRHPDLAADDAG
jgi:integrase